MQPYLKDLIEKAKQKKMAQAKNAVAREPAVPEAREQDTVEIAQKIELLDKKMSEKIEKPLAEEKTVPGAEEKQERKSDFESQLDGAKKTIVAAYGDVQIYKIEGMPMYYYFVPVPKPTSAERGIINTIKEAATRLITIAPYKIRDPQQRRNVYYQKIMEILQASNELKIPENRMGFYAEAVVREMVGYGMIDQLVRDDKLEEIMVIGAMQPVYVFHREFEMMPTNIEFYTDNEIQDLINKIAREVGRRVDISAPLLDARLPDGSRVNATIPPASVSGSTLTIRKFKAEPYSMIDLINMNTMTSEVAAFLWLAVEGMGTVPANILIAGGTGSGKTTTLNVLASFIPPRERVISIEDTAELNLPLKHWIRMEARPPGLEGKGEITLDILTKNALRMRPDRIIVGEVRHDEAFTLFTALNTGHDGALSGDTLVCFSDGSITEIGDFAEKVFSENQAVVDGEFEFVPISENKLVPSLNKQTLKIENKRITRVWRKKTKGKLFKIRLSGGKKLLLTADHPIYRINNGLQEISAGEAKAGNFIAVPASIETTAEKKLMAPHLAGLIYGDGHLGKEAIQFVNKEESVLLAFEREILPITENKISRFDYGGFSRIQLYDKKLIRMISEKYCMPIGNKTKTFRLCESTLSAKDADIAELLRGLFDCEAHVNLHANCIEFSTSNNDLAKKLPLVLLRFGIFSSTYAQNKDGKGNMGPYYRVLIHGKENIGKFSEKIGFLHENKRKKTEALVEKAKGSLDLFPDCQRLLKKARLEAGLTQQELGLLLGATTGTSVLAYETNARNPSRKQLEKICSILQSETAKQLQMLAHAEARFEKIVSVEEEQFEGMVYDLTVEDNHNYIANGILVSNCMGTIHANSPRETIVRVTNPPMRVPEVMLSGLDFIVMEHRIHDRKKGTIRRITEIAELTGVLEGKAQTQTIFDRDPMRDTIERTNIPSNYLKKIERFTALSKRQVEEELFERQMFLERLLRKDTHIMQDVSKAATGYFLNKRGING